MATVFRLVRERIKRRERELDPQPEMQNPRFRIEGHGPLGSPTPMSYHLGNVEVVLKNEVGQRAYGRRVNLARVSVKPSTIPNAGYGVHLRQAVVAGQVILKYWGFKVTLEEAERRRREVHRSMPYPLYCRSSLNMVCVTGQSSYQEGARSALLPGL